MLWYKAWLDTRWRFAIGLLVMVCSAAVLVLEYPRLMELTSKVSTLQFSGEIGRQVNEGLALTRSFRGYIWSQAFLKTLLHLGTLFAILLGTGGLAFQSSRADAFTLSLPVSRRRLVWVRAGLGLGLWLVLAIVPALLIPLLSPAVGQHYGPGTALVHGFCMFVVGSVFLSLAVLLSTWFGDVWRPVLLALLTAILLAVPEMAAPGLSRYGVYGVMSGASFFRTGQVPWVGLLVSAALSAALLYAAAANLARRDA